MDEIDELDVNQSVRELFTLDEADNITPKYIRVNAEKKS